MQKYFFFAKRTLFWKLTQKLPKWRLSSWCVLLFNALCGFFAHEQKAIFYIESPQERQREYSDPILNSPFLKPNLDNVGVGFLSKSNLVKWTNLVKIKYWTIQECQNLPKVEIFTIQNRLNQRFNTLEMLKFGKLKFSHFKIG